MQIVMRLVIAQLNLAARHELNRKVTFKMLVNDGGAAWNVRGMKKRQVNRHTSKITAINAAVNSRRGGWFGEHQCPSTFPLGIEIVLTGRV
jgi:hypothetical protein